MIHHSDVIATEDWGTGFCSCFEVLVPNCLMAWCCPCISLAQITSRLGLYKYGEALMFFIIGVIFTPIALIGGAFLRSEVRKRYRIDGNLIWDCILLWLFPCCAIAQMATHVKSYKPGSCDFGPPDTLPPYNISELG